MDAQRLVSLPSPLPSPDDARRKRDADQKAALNLASATTMIVTAVSNNLVSVANLSGDDMGDAVRAGGLDVAVNDLVLCVPVFGTEGDVEYVVIDRIDPNPVTARSLRTLLIANAGIVNSDVGWAPARQDTADTASTPNTGTFVDAMSASLALPAGTFTVKCLISLAMKRSPAGQAHLRAVIDGNNGATRVVNCDASLYTAHIQTGYQTGIAGNRSIVVKIQFKGDSGTGVTTSAIEPLLWATYERTA